MTRDVPPLLEAAREVQSILAEAGMKGVLIGGLALMRWGEPRLTRDVDFTVLCPLGAERTGIRALLARLEGRIPDAEDFAATSRVLLARAANGIPVDIALGALPYEERAVKRGSTFEYAPGISLRTCSAEDLIVMKAFAGRERDLLDLESILARQAGKLDWPLIEQELTPLLAAKDDHHSWERLMKMRGSKTGGTA